MTRISLIQER